MQSENASSAILVTELWMLIEVKFEQPQNALSPIEVTDLGKVIEVKPEQSQNALEPISVTESEMTLASSIPPGKHIKVLLSFE